ncbi:AraC family transcriptional regulator [Brevundimonas sp.]|jgi:AraC-like DNA-binding protein|uniref:helix-turn-helix transcriptional regulator n=1 Tax=Brevundimonas sp. TaxID=1871086 RepID=UPI00391B6581
MNSTEFRVRALDGADLTSVDARSGRAFARHSHDEFGVGVITFGAQRSWSGRGAVEAIVGNVITVNPAELHDGAAIGSERAWSMLYFSKRFIGSMVSDLSEGRTLIRELHAPVVDDTRVADLFLGARKAALISPRGQAFEERMLMLFNTLFGLAKSTMPAGSERLSMVRERIDDDPAHPHTLSELAKIAGLSRFQTLRAFARLTGSTPHAYVIQRRLEAARGLIRNGVTLADAAATVGFADQSHMHRVFTSRYGFTPGAYAGAHGHPNAISFKRSGAATR